ncbi:MAG: carbohydrate binding family 9 domain-containing protein, partial [Candidatus Edwardsbacteria bacterium]|nr:carbohydrate binding family 9 domain-containing protein [Candidatus Edwardsbacteria bacterium]
MKTISFFIAIGMTGLAATGHCQPADSSKTVIQAAYAERAPVIDGDISDPCWQTPTPASGFIQKKPKEGQPATESTAVRICYDRERLYLAFACFEQHPGKISARTVPREEGDYGDYVVVMLDTYDDRRGAYRFAVNPKGIQMDGFLSEDGANHDQSWNAVWRSGTKINPDCWTAEMAIPFKALRFPDKADQQWGINLGRYIPHHSEMSWWRPVTQSDGYPRISK